MRLKRIYEHDKEGGLVLDSDGNPVLDYIKLLRSGPRQKFSDRLVGSAILEGWIALTDKKLTLLTKPRAVYRIERRPGYYCCHCGDAIDGNSNDAKTHLESEHKDKKSPDPSNPAGYERIHYYDCVKVTTKGKGS